MLTYNPLTKEEIKKIERVYMSATNAPRLIFISLVPIVLGLFYTMLLSILADVTLGNQMFVASALFAFILVLLAVMAIYAGLTVKSKEWEEMLHKIDRETMPTGAMQYDQTVGSSGTLANSPLYISINPSSGMNQYSGAYMTGEASAIRGFFGIMNAISDHVEEVANRVGIHLEEKIGFKRKLALVCFLIVTAVFIYDMTQGMQKYSDELKIVNQNLSAIDEVLSGEFEYSDFDEKSNLRNSYSMIYYIDRDLKGPYLKLYATADGQIKEVTYHIRYDQDLTPDEIIAFAETSINKMKVALSKLDESQIDPVFLEYSYLTEEFKEAVFAKKGNGEFYTESYNPEMDGDESLKVSFGMKEDDPYVYLLIEY